jgi:sugar transferase (PEP-CTERM/EpsH1 system associated)
MKKLKIAHVVFSLKIGGLEKVVVDIISHLDRQKFESVVYCVGHKGVYAEALENRGIEVRLVNEQSFIKRIVAFSTIFKNEKFDIVHSNSGVYRDATLAAIIARVPMIMHTDHGKFYPDNKITRLTHRFFSVFRDKIITVSDHIKDFIANEVRVNRTKIMRIHNGVNINEYDVVVDISRKKIDLGIALEKKVVGTIARLAPIKDHMTLLAAFEKIVKTHKDVKLLIVGDGPLREALCDKVVEFGIAHDVIFLGARNDVAELLKIMDIVCLSSLSEGLSMTLIEGMASGKPVVATRVGGNMELIIDKVTGYLVPPRDPKEMAEAISILLNDGSLRKVMGIKGKERIAQHFNINNVARKYEDVYFELAHKKGIM